MKAGHDIPRHKHRATALLGQARGLLVAGGGLLYCDHYFDPSSGTGIATFT
jgi:hypothetical protein